MPSVIDVKIRAYQTGNIALDDLAEPVIPYVKDLLTLMSHTIAIYDRSDQWPAILDLIRSTEGGRRFLRQNLDIITNQLSNREGSVSDSKTAVAAAVEDIFVHCGLGFQTVGEACTSVFGPLRNSPSRWQRDVVANQVDCFLATKPRKRGTVYTRPEESCCRGLVW